MSLECCGAQGTGPCEAWCMCTECRRWDWGKTWERDVCPALCNVLARWPGAVLVGLLVWQVLTA